MSDITIKQFAARIPQGLWDELEKKAATQGISGNQAVCRAIEYWVIGTPEPAPGTMPGNSPAAEEAPVSAPKKLKVSGSGPAHRKTPPDGLSQSGLQRWFRENK